MQEIIKIEMMDLKPGENNDSNINKEHKIIKNVIEKTMFGMTYLQGPDDLNCLIFVHQSKENYEKLD